VSVQQQAPLQQQAPPQQLPQQQQQGLTQLPQHQRGPPAQQLPPQQRPPAQQQFPPLQQSTTYASYASALANGGTGARLEPKIVLFCAPDTESGCRATIVDTIGRCQVLGTDAPMRAGSARRRLEVLLPSDTPQSRVSEMITSLGWANLRAVPWLPHGSRPGPTRIQG
jgi:hypothetical protein